MLQGVLAAADIERIAVCQEGQAFLLFDDVGHSLGEIGAQKCQVCLLYTSCPLFFSQGTQRRIIWKLPIRPLW